jgi:hypothetical protein
MAFISNGTTILDNGAFQSSLGNLVLLSEQTASGSASIEFTSGIDSTYPIYKFKYINLHPATNNVNLNINFSSDNGSNYNVTKTTTFFDAFHTESGSSTGFGYRTGNDLAQSTGEVLLNYNIGAGNENDESSCGEMFLFAPSSTTFVKHFMIVNQSNTHASYSLNEFSAGYGNTTSAINGVRFKMSSGNLDSGTIKLYGIKDS